MKRNHDRTRRNAGVRANLFWTASSAATSQASFLALNVLLARTLAPSEFADFVVLTTVATFVPALFSFGLERLGVVFLANADTDFLAWATSVIRVALIGSAGAGACTAIVVYIGLLTANTPALAASCVAFILAENARIALADLPRAWNRPDLASAASPGVPRVLTICGLLLTVALGQQVTLESTLLFMLTTTILSCAVALLAIAQRSRSANVIAATASAPNSSAGVRPVLRAGSALSVGNIALVSLNQLDVLVVAVFFPPEVVASYAVVSRLSNLVGNVVTMVNVALLPRLSRMPRNDDEASSQELLARTAMTTLFAFSIIPVAIFCSFSGRVLEALFGSQYSVAGYIAPILMLGQLLNVTTGLSGSFLLRDGRRTLIVCIQGFSAVLIAPLELLAGQVQFLPGIAAASALGTSLSSVIMAIVLWRSYGIKTWINLSTLSNIKINPTSVWRDG